MSALVSGSYDQLVEQETLIFAATEAVCEAMEGEDSNAAVTRKQLAKRLGESKSHVTQLLSGERNLTLRTLADLAFALDRRVVISLAPIAAPPGQKAASTQPVSLPEGPAFEEAVGAACKAQGAAHREWMDGEEEMFTEEISRGFMRAALAAALPYLQQPRPVGDEEGLRQHLEAEFERWIEHHDKEADRACKAHNSLGHARHRSARDAFADALRVVENFSPAQQRSEESS